MDEFYKKFKDSINNIPEENPAVDAWDSFEQFRTEQTPTNHDIQSKPISKEFHWFFTVALLALLVATNIWWKYQHDNLQSVMHGDTKVANQEVIHNLNHQLKQVQGKQFESEAQIAELENERNMLRSALKMHSSQTNTTPSTLQTTAEVQKIKATIDTPITQLSSTMDQVKAPVMETIGKVLQTQTSIVPDSSELLVKDFPDAVLASSDIEYFDYNVHIPLRNRLVQTDQNSTLEKKWRMNLARGTFVKKSIKGRIRPPAMQIGLTIERKLGKHFNLDVGASYMALKHKLNKKDFPQVSKDDIPSGAILKQVREIRRAYWFSSGLDYAFHLGKIRFELGGGMNYIRLVRDEYALSVETIDKRSLEINPTPDKKPISLLNSYLHAGVQVPLYSSWNLSFDVKQYMDPRKRIQLGSNTSYHAGVSYLF